MKPQQQKHQPKWVHLRTDTNRLLQPHQEHLRMARSGDITLKLNAQNKKLKQNIEELNFLFGQQTLSNQQMSRTSTLCNNKLKRYRQKSKDAEIGFNSVMKQINELRLSLQSVSRGRQFSEEVTIQNLNSFLDQLKDTLIPSTSPAECQTKESLDYYEKQINLLKDELISLMKTISSTHREQSIPPFETLQALAKGEDLSLSEVITEIFELKAENQSLHGKTYELEGQVCALSSKLKENVIEIDEGEEERLSEIKVLELEKDELLERLRQMKKQAQLQSEFLKQQLRQSQAKVVQCEEEMSDIVNGKKQLPASLIQISQSYKFLERQKRQSQQSIETLTKFIKEMQTEITSLHSQKQEILTKLKEKQDQNLQLEEEIAKVKEEFQKQQKKYESLELNVKKGQLTEPYEKFIDYDKLQQKNKEESKLQQTNERLQNLLKHTLSTITSITEQIQSIQTQLSQKNSILESLQLLYPKKLNQLLQKLEQNLMSNQQQLNQQRQGINVNKINLYLQELEYNIKTLQKGKWELGVAIEKEKQNKNQMETILMQEIKQLKENNEHILLYLESAYLRIRGSHNQHFLHQLQREFFFTGNSIGSEHAGTQTDESVTELFLQTLDNQYLSEDILSQLKLYVNNAKSREFMENYYFLESKQCFLQVYMQQNEAKLEWYKSLLAEKLTPNELEILFDEREGLEELVTNLKDKIQQLQIKAIQSDKRIRWIEQAKSKHPSISSQLSQTLEANIMKMLNANSDQEVEDAIEGVFRSMQEHEDKCYSKLIKKDKVFKHHTAIINKICKRQMLKEEEEIKKSMILGQGHIFAGLRVPKRTQRRQSE